jgi:KDO2-lipid IV(A) lauroyltransferase
VHYFFADWLIYPLMMYVVRYRRRLVAKNLRLSFPDKTPAERRQIARDFYHQFCYTLVETIYGSRRTNDELRERELFENAETVNRAAKEYGGCIVMMAHMGNWEWKASCQNWFDPEVTELNIYRKLKNEKMDALMLDIRSKRDGQCVEKQRILREMVRYRAAKKPIVVGLIADQKPRPEVTRTWLTFLNQETGFLDGGEMLAKKFNYPVFALHVRRPKRGYYESRFDLISMTPQDTADGEITTAYARLLEKNILEQPELWLWTHNRFKWKRPNE